jgi:hypothetical protein
MKHYIVRWKTWDVTTHSQIITAKSKAHAKRLIEEAYGKYTNSIVVKELIT